MKRKPKIYPRWHGLSDEQVSYIFDLIVTAVILATAGLLLFFVESSILDRIK